ncbi:hypothetical protein BDF20DRAFT_856159 [Mycotypha africana]|uniref:uncharacterized protein n=1 Tax=Mycotypha africana TaxID=64632 RepID=UPI00230150E0|nr:uncharacterized protein BDF20DRAFT_856159 [Mycotypha africana]KAI8988517.1 hypothetical protein BDF20DRAFT_856159 [Mycotypha africana]
MKYSGSVIDTRADQISLHKRSFPICPKCNQTCLKDDHSVMKAFNQVYHNQCFVCEDCQKPVADKYFLVDDQPQHQTYQQRKKLVLCEFHHLSRLGLICLTCNQPITATTTAAYNYHPECVQCPLCTTTTSDQYEFKGKSYCRLHFSLIPETHCAGCTQAILDQYIEHQSLPNQIWHPECYMIFKFWSVKLLPATYWKASDVANLIHIQEQTQKIVSRVWTDVSSFEESSANCISDMLLNVAAGSFIEGMKMANHFVLHLEILLNGLNILNRYLLLQNQEIQCNEESILICKQIIQFFQLLSTPAEHDGSITQELLLLVTNLAQNLKLLIRSGLSTALRLEREYGIKDATIEFLDQLSELDKRRIWIAGRPMFKDMPNPSVDIAGIPVIKCNVCHQDIANMDYFVCQQQTWHVNCLKCGICSQSLNEKSTLVVADTPYCRSCCIDSDSTKIRYCKLVTPLEHSLERLKLFLAKMSFDTTASHITIQSQPNNATITEENEEKVELNKSIPTKVKRQHSLLRKLKNRVQDQQSINTPGRRSSIKIGRFGRQSINSADTVNKRPVVSEKNSNSIFIDTATPLYPNGESSSISPTSLEQHTPTIVASPITPLAPLSVTSQKENNLYTSFRRTFSTDSQRKRRSSLINVFDRRKRKESRRTSVSTVDEAGATTLFENMYFPYLTTSQDFIVRYASIVALQPLMSPPIPFNEVLSFINSNTKKKNSTNSRKKTVNTALFYTWERLLMKNFKPSSSLLSSPIHKGEKVPVHKTIGIPLSVIALRDYELELKRRKKIPENDKKGVALLDMSPAFIACLSDEAFIPSFVKGCITLLLKSDISTEGIFRKNGNIRQLRLLCASIDELEPVNADQATIENLLANENSIQLAALLKKYLRELPEPLLTFSLYELFIRCGRIESKNRKRALHLACCLLPKPNRDTMLLIFCCLKWVSSFSEMNKMSITNLARVFAPTILFGKTAVSNSAAEEARQSAEEEINVIETLIQEVDEISKVPSDLATIAIDNVFQFDKKDFIKQYQQLLVSDSDVTQKSSKSNHFNAFIRKSKAFESCLQLSDSSGPEKTDTLLSPARSEKETSIRRKQRRKSWLYTFSHHVVAL